eukprot:Skav203238  [mRNA]  locus=scaffold2746:152563:162464:+ [translate_table: standard]
MSGCPSKLEPAWHQMSVGDEVSFVAKMILWDPTGEKHLVRTLVGGCFVVVFGPCSNVAEITVLQGKITQMVKGLRVDGQSGHILSHTPGEWSDLQNVIETCSGMGFLGEGVASCGQTIKVVNDVRSVWCDFQAKQPNFHGATVTGDIGQAATIAEIHAKCPRQAMLTAGFSCQPWSVLGDQGRFQDGRSDVLDNVLTAGYQLRCHTILLECVTGAGRDKGVQTRVQQFCHQTGYKMSQIELSLHPLFPARRDRWWCLLTHPCMPEVALQPLPTMPYQPTLGMIMPVFHTWSQEALKHIALDRYETMKHDEYGDLQQLILKVDGVCPTALHGWGNQLSHCPCGCRTKAMSDRRLKEKGIFAALILTGGEWIMEYNRMPKVRYLHPWELAFIHGCNPNRDWGTDLRLGIAGLGQMASPIQSCWMTAQWKYQVCTWLDLSTPTPEEMLWDHVKSLVASVAASSPALAKQPVFANHFQAMKQEPAQEDLINSQRTGRNDPEEKKSGVTSSGGGIADKQPASGTPEPIEQFDDQPSTATALSPFDHFHQAAQEGDQSNSFAHDHQGEEVVLNQESLEEISATQIDENAENTMDDGYGITDAHDEDDETMDISVDDMHAAFAQDSPIADVACDQPDPCQSEVPTSSGGGIPAFATKQEEVSPLRLHPVSHVQDHVRIEVPKIEGPRVHPTIPQRHECQYIWVHHLGEHEPCLIKLGKHATVGQVQAAESALRLQDDLVRVTTEVGCVIPLADTTTLYQHVFLTPIQAHTAQGCLPEEFLARYGSATRAQVLRNQQGWVSDAEFHYYLKNEIKIGCSVAIATPFVVPSHMELVDCQDDFDTWVDHVTELVAVSKCIATGVLFKHQWVPVLVKVTEETLHVYTIHEGKAIIAEGFRRKFSQSEDMDHFMHVHHLHREFEHDCGFQSIGWLRQQLGETSHKVTAKEAGKWRILYSGHLFQSNQGKEEVTCGTIAFGGGKDVDITHGLQLLLTQHGVKDDVVVERAAVVIERLGRHQVQTCLRSAHSWRDLKALANQASQKTKKAKATETKTPVQLQTTDIVIPKGVFQDPNGGEIQQITFADVNPEATGVIVAHSSEATAYLKKAQGLSKNALGLILLDAQNPWLHGVGEEMRIPAQYASTSEPLLTTVKLVQLGMQPIRRWKPPQVLQVTEVPTEVVRLVAYKDELDENWSDLTDKPVKFLLSKLPMLQVQPSGDNPIIDCWDRQFVTAKMERCPPAHAHMFLVNLRVSLPQPGELLKQSGQHGIYAEPRTVDGRQPAPSHRVIWLPKFSKSEAQVALQSTQVEATLARYASRYGLRVLSTCAEAVHKVHRPTVPFLAAGEAIQYVGGPFPFGTTKASLVALFQKWGWNARPLQPAGRAATQQGLLWNIQASAPPAFEVYQLTHGDVLLSKVTKPTKQTIQKTDIQASKQTLDHMRAQQTKQIKQGEDFLQHDDPWARPSDPKQSKQMSDANAEAMALAIQRRVEASLASQSNTGSAPSDQDINMQEAKIDELEDRLAKIETTVQANHMQQQKDTRKSQCRLDKFGPMLRPKPLHCRATSIKGPIIGTINPTGLLGKAELLHTLPQGMWGASETHLTPLGLQKFRAELRHQQPSMHIVPGHPSAYVSSTQGTIGGRATGVGILTACPARALTSSWADELWQSSRIQAAAVLHQEVWYKIGVVYGYSKDSQTKDVKAKTKRLLNEMTQRLVYQAYGPRIIMGDFNGDCDDYEAVQEWKRHGFVEVQQYAEQKWGRTPMVTCKNSTIKDFLFISRELVPLLQRVVVEPGPFADHPILYGEFQDFPKPQSVDIWQRPLPLPWDQCSLPLVSPDPEPAVPSDIPALFQSLETMVDQHLLHQGQPGLVSAQRGPVQHACPHHASQVPTPLRRSRPHEFEIQYHGENWRHVMWVNQLRRLQSYRALARSSKDSSAVKQHRAHLWSAIRCGRGFPGGFAKVWHLHIHKQEGCPGYLPKLCPDHSTADAICRAFKIEFDRLEQALNQARMQAAQTRRQRNAQVVFKDVKKPQANAVQTIVEQINTPVTEITDDGQCIHYAPGALRLDEPLWHGFVLRYYERDLGGHLAYSRLHTNATVTGRIANHKQFWTWLRRSFAPNSQKLHMLLAVAWPRMLHGISGVILGSEHFRKLRSQAMQVMSWNKQGASSLIQFGLLLAPQHDPEFWAIKSTVLTMRKVSEPEQICSVLDALAFDPPKGNVPGPGGVLLHSLHALGWAWEGNGFVRDHQGLCLTLFDDPIQKIQYRLEHAWQTRIGMMLASRKDFSGLSGVDAPTTQQLLHHVKEDEGLMRTSLNGTFYTMDKLVHATQAETDQCPFCQMPDSLQHRLWECGHTQGCRAHVSVTDLQAIQTLPDCARLHGWVMESTNMVMFQQELMKLQDATAIHELPQELAAGCLQLFTDGSCASPAWKPGRLATWGVVCADLSQDVFVPVAHGGVPGVTQTALRGEITAAIAALNILLSVGCHGNVWTDSDTVYRRIVAFQSGFWTACGADSKDHDLWQRLLDLLSTLRQRGLRCRPVKVRAHQDEAAYSCVIERWAIRGNEAADRLADWARSQLPIHLLHLWSKVLNHGQQHHALMKLVHQVIRNVGIANISRKQTTAPKTSDQQVAQPAQSDPLTAEEPSWVWTAECVDLPRTNSAYSIANLLEPWISELQDDTAAPVWISFYQLFVLYQFQTQQVGFYYDTKLRKWMDATEKADREGYSFLQMSHGFSGAVRCIVKAKRMRCDVQRKCPCGTVFRCWVCSICLRISPVTIQQIDKLFHWGGVTTVRDVKKGLLSFPFVSGINSS